MFDERFGLFHPQLFCAIKNHSYSSRKLAWNFCAMYVSLLALINFELTTSNTIIKLRSFELKYKTYVNGSLTTRLIVVTDKITKNVLTNLKVTIYETRY